MAGKDAGAEAQQRCVRRRGRSQTPSGAGRMRTHPRRGAL